MKTKFRITALLIVISAVISFSNFNVMAFDAPKTGTDLNKGLPEVEGTVGQAAAVKDGIDINSATPEMLAKIPGIDPKIAEGIAAYREANGAFTNVKDLLNVDGITPELLDKIKPLLSKLL